MGTDRTAGDRQIGTLLGRPKFYNNVDGVGELSIGFLCLAAATLSWLQANGGPDSPWVRIYMPFLWFGPISAIIHFGSKAIKEHITYPRTGFVEYRKVDMVWRPLFIALAVAVPLSIAVFFLVRNGSGMRLLPALICLTFAGTYAHSFTRTAPWKWAVAWALVCGSVAIALLPESVAGVLAKAPPVARYSREFVGAMLLPMLLYGTLLSISGLASFWLYLRKTRPPVREDR